MKLKQSRLIPMLRRYQPCIVVLAGPPLHGKSATAQLIESLTNFLAFDVDNVLVQSIGPSIRLLPEQAIAPVARAYAAMTVRAQMAVYGGSPALVSGTFSTSLFRRPLLRIIEHREAPPIRVFQLEVPSVQEIRRRLASRLAQGCSSFIDSEERYAWALSLVEPWPTDIPVTQIDTSGSVAATVERILVHLSDLELRCA